MKQNHIRSNYNLEPFKRFEEDKYHIIVPLSGLENLAYVPAYGDDYEQLGILETTYAVHPVAYVALKRLNDLAGDFGVRFNITDAWRPLETQREKYDANVRATYDDFIQKFPADTMPFDEWKEFYGKDKWKPLFDKLNGKILKHNPTNFADPGNKVTPHGAGVAFDLVMATPELGTFAKRDKSGKVVFECPQFVPYPRTKWLPKELNAASYLANLTDLHPGFANKNPLASTHQVARPDAPREVREAVANSDFQCEMVSALYPVGRTNDEDYHFQLTGDYTISYRNFTIAEAKSFAPTDVLAVKNELDDYADEMSDIFYDDGFRKLTRNNIRADKFNPAGVISRGDLLGKLKTIKKSMTQTAVR
jgi:hypothetical protein